MNPSSPDQTRGELLRQLRETQNLDVTEVARLVNLSSAQVRELESGAPLNGERSLFYTPAIKDKAAVKLSQALGADPQTLWGPTESSPAQENALLPDLQILDDLAVLLKKQAQAQEMGARDRRFTWVWMLGAFVALWVAGAIGFYGHQISHWFQNWRAEQTIQQVTATMSAVNPPVEIAPAVPAVAAAPVETASQASPAALPAPPELPVSAPVAASNVPSGCESQAPLTTLRPSQPSKVGNTVHLVATGDLQLCVRDGLGKQTNVTLKAQESRTLLGKAPWSIRTEKPAPANFHLFFQGQKLYWPPGDIAGVILKEVAGDF